MNLTFGICWIEDQASKAEVEAIENAVRHCGFEPDIKRIENEEKIRKFANWQEHFYDYDLILLDLRLGTGLRGDELAPKVRNRFRSTPILFYSTEEEQILRKMIAEKLIDGVYCTHRHGLAERVGEMVRDLRPALNRLSGMRGTAAGVVAACDEELRTILIHWGSNPDIEAELVKLIKERVEKNNHHQLERIGKIERLEELLKDHASASGLLFSVVRTYIHAEKINVQNQDEIHNILHNIQKYPEKVISIRNILAHALEQRTEDGWKIIRPGANPDLTVHEFDTFRSDFLFHLRDLRRLRELLLDQESD